MITDPPDLGKLGTTQIAVGWPSTDWSIDVAKQGVTMTRWTEPVAVRTDGLILREWSETDIQSMVELFNTAEMDRWTPLPHPFDARVAASYVRAAHEAKAGGTLQLAITVDGGRALGEVILFPTEEARTCEFAFAVGHEHRGQGLAARAVMALIPTALRVGYEMGRMVISRDNVSSERSAVVAGFTQARVPLQRRERKRYVLQMATWARDLTGGRQH